MFIALRDAANQLRDAAKLKYPPIDRLQPRSSQRFEAKIENVTTKRNHDLKEAKKHIGKC